MVTRRGVASLVLLAAFVCAGCKRRPEHELQTTDPAPVDHLATGELAEGAEKAFALRLPAGATVTMRFTDSVHVRSTLPPPKLAEFVRARVTSGGESIADGKTTFTDVVVPAEPRRHVTIEIRYAERLSGARSEMLVKDVTPPPAPDPNATEAELRRKAGLTPDGKLLDPKHMQ